jgi:hypothetical protein
MARPINERLVGHDAYQSLDLDFLTEHITSFCLAALRQSSEVDGSRAAAGGRALAAHHK